MMSPARMKAGFASSTRAFLNLTLLRSRYDAAIAELPAINGPAIVLGSAPNPQRPEGLTPDWFVVTVNASQVTASDFDLDPPDLTLLRSEIQLGGNHQDAVWKSLAGKRTKHLVSVVASPEDGGIATFAAERNYSADRITELNRHVRGAIIAEVSGRYYVKISSGVSNGILATLVALKLGGNPVVMSGFSFGPGWYFAKEEQGPRAHITADAAVCLAIANRGLPVFTSDPEFAESSGIRLWRVP